MHANTCSTFLQPHVPNIRRRKQKAGKRKILVEVSTECSGVSGLLSSALICLITRVIVSVSHISHVSIRFKPPPRDNKKKDKEDARRKVIEDAEAAKVAAENAKKEAEEEAKRQIVEARSIREAAKSLLKKERKRLRQLCEGTAGEPLCLQSALACMGLTAHA